MKTFPKDEFVQIPARFGKEALFADNDIWPGDLATVHLRTLGQEAAQLAVSKLNQMLEEQIYAAFQQGKDYVVSQFGVDHESIWSTEPNFSIDVQFKGRISEPGEFDTGLPIGWKLYRVADWQEGRIT